MTEGAVLMLPDRSGVAGFHADLSAVGGQTNRYRVAGAVGPGNPIAKLQLIHSLQLILRSTRYFATYQFVAYEHWAACLEALRQPRLSPFDQAQRDLDEMIDLEPNWDSYGSPPPSVLAIQTAHAFLDKVAQELEEEFGEHLRPFVVAPAPGGGVYFEWRTPHGTGLELEIGSDGSFGYLLIQQEEGKQVFSEAEAAPRDVVIGHVATTLLPLFESRSHGRPRPS